MIDINSHFRQVLNYSYLIWNANTIFFSFFGISILMREKLKFNNSIDIIIINVIIDKVTMVILDFLFYWIIIFNSVYSFKVEIKTSGNKMFINIILEKIEMRKMVTYFVIMILVITSSNGSTSRQGKKLFFRAFTILQVRK